MNAIEYLEQVKLADARVDAKRAEERELWTLATGMTQGYDGMPRGSGATNKVEDIVAKIVKAQERTNAQIDRYIDIRDDVIRHIEMLPLKQYQILHWLYVRKKDWPQKGYYTWSEVAEGLNCTEQNISNIRRRAIKNLQKILDAERVMVD